MRAALQRAFDDSRAKQTTTTQADVVVASIVLHAHPRRARLEGKRDEIWEERLIDQRLWNVAQNRQRQLQLKLLFVWRWSTHDPLRAGILIKYDDSNSPESVWQTSSEIDKSSWYRCCFDCDECTSPNSALRAGILMESGDNASPVSVWWTLDKTKKEESCWWCFWFGSDGRPILKSALGAAYEWVMVAASDIETSGRWHCE